MFTGGAYPTKPPTPPEVAVIVVLVAATLIVLGGVAMVLGFVAPIEKHAIAVQAIRYGAWSLGIGLAIAIVFRLYIKFKD
jgi:hypothetical protein